MKYLKTYETISKPYKNGDYALVKLISKNITFDDVLANFLEVSNLTDQFIKIKILNHLDIFNINTIYLIQPHQIICWSESKKELELLIDIKKYNI
jgi:hypothetical protein